MKELVTREDRHQLDELCETIQQLIKEKKYETGVEKVTQAIGEYPHAPHPHNLMGILLEISGDKGGAMKHYRAAIALEPSYHPARANLYRNGDLSENSSRYTF
jgi:Flp pilus assembly protein TadD